MKSDNCCSDCDQRGDGAGHSEGTSLIPDVSVNVSVKTSVICVITTDAHYRPDLYCLERFWEEIKRTSARELHKPERVVASGFNDRLLMED